MERKENKAVRNSLASYGLRTVLFLAMILCLATGFMLLNACYWMDQSDGRMRSFQKAVGGVGMGADSTPAWNLIHYDPRLQSVDDSNLWPTPGGYPFSPSAVSIVIVFREFPWKDLQIVKADEL